MKAIVLAGSKGIGKGISDELNLICDEVISTSSSDLDTSNIEQVKEFVSEQQETDILVLNTGGPPAKDFYDITEDEWFKYYNQLFYSFVYILQNLNINDGGYIFLISSHQIKETKDTKKEITLSLLFLCVLLSGKNACTHIKRERGGGFISTHP